MCTWVAVLPNRPDMYAGRNGPSTEKVMAFTKATAHAHTYRSRYASPPPERDETRVQQGQTRVVHDTYDKWGRSRLDSIGFD